MTHATGSHLQFPDGNGNQRWSYWPDGLVKQVTTLNAGVETYSYAYSRRGLLIGEVQSPTDGEALAMGYAYDALGNLSAHRYPSGNVVAYAPNALGQAGQAGSYAAGVVYYPNGAIRQFTYGNGIVHSMVQNARQLPDESQDTLGATRILSDGYDYDAVGNVMAITDGATGRNQRGNRNLGYDALDRLVSASSPMFGSASYSYDALDNLTRVTILGRDHHYCYDNAWRLTNVKVNGCGGSTVVGLAYDAQGNLRAKNGQPFAFDFGNRLRAAAGSESYRYDADGRRTQTDSSFGRITSMYDHAGVLRYQASEREDKRTDYITLGGSLVAKAAVPRAGVRRPRRTSLGGRLWPLPSATSSRKAWTGDLDHGLRRQRRELDVGRTPCHQLCVSRACLWRHGELHAGVRCLTCPASAG
jgi:YD repeat-containing protein